MTTQTTHSITEQVIDIIATQQQCPKEQILPEADFENDLGFDSLELVEFIMAIEEAFNIQVPDEDADKIKTVQQAVDKIERALKC